MLTDCLLTPIRDFAMGMADIAKIGVKAIAEIEVSAVKAGTEALATEMEMTEAIDSCLR